MAHWERAVDLRFHGLRFDGGALDVDVMPEIVAYKSLVESIAAALWRGKHPERVRLDKGFEASFALRMVGLAPGSAVAQLERARVSAQPPLPTIRDDDFDESMSVINDVIECAAHGRSLPPQFPRSMIRRFGLLGKRLAANEWVEIAPPGKAGVRFDGERRHQLLALAESSYEDSADEVGFVLATSVRKGRFELYGALDSSEPIDVPLAEKFEALVLDVARDYQNARIRVRGRGAFDADGALLRFVNVTDIDPYGANAHADVDNASLFAALQAVSDAIPENESAGVPRDAAANLDTYLRRGTR